MKVLWGGTRVLFEGSHNSQETIIIRSPCGISKIEGGLSIVLHRQYQILVESFKAE